MFTLKRTADRRNGVTTTLPRTARSQPGPELGGKTVVVIGGSAGIGLEIARSARAAGAVHVGTWMPFVTWPIGTSGIGRSGHRSCHISRQISP